MSSIRKYFKSRWSTGYLAEYDFSQLEVIGLAQLSQDKMLIQDILNGMDMHCLNASFLYNQPYATIKHLYDSGDAEWTKKRKISKAPGFLIQYGGGAKAMADQTGLPKKQCQGFIDNYYKRYMGVKAWQDNVAHAVKQSRRPSEKRTKAGLPSGYGEYLSPTGRRYGFQEYDDFHGGTSFSPTQMKNYPVQGFATGDIVPLVVGKLFRVLKNSEFSESCLMVNTVHDSIVFDIESKEVLNDVHELIMHTMESAPEYLKQIFNIDFQLPLKVDGEAGKNWLEMKPVSDFIIPF